MNNSQKPSWIPKISNTTGLNISLIFTLLPIVIFFVIFIFAVPTTLERLAILILMTIPWFLVLLLTVIFLARRYEARIQKVLAGDYWVVWQYPTTNSNQHPNGKDRADKIYFGPQGVLLADDPLILIDFGIELLGAVVVEPDTGESALEFTYGVKRRSVVGYSTRTRLDYLVSIANLGAFNAGTQTMTISIPKGRQLEAEELAKRFRFTLLGSAFGSFIDRWLGLSVYFVATMVYFIIGFMVSVSPPR